MDAMAAGGAGFSDEERAAMKQRAEELKAMKGLKGAAKLAKENEACLEAIEKLEGTDRAIGERVHVIVMEEAPHLTPKTFFDETAQLDDGPMWPVSFAVLEVTPEVEKEIRELVRRAAPAA